MRSSPQGNYNQRGGSQEVKHSLSVVMQFPVLKRLGNLLPESHDDAAWKLLEDILEHAEVFSNWFQSAYYIMGISGSHEQEDCGLDIFSDPYNISNSFKTDVSNAKQLQFLSLFRTPRIQKKVKTNQPTTSTTNEVEN